MDSTSLLSGTTLVKPLSTTVDTTSQSSQSTDQSQTSDQSGSSGDPFESLLQSFLSPGADKSVSEENLFAAMTVQRVGALKGDDAGKKFGELLLQTEQQMKSANGHIPYEDAARVALKKFTDQGDLTSDEADKVNSEAFDAAQLDDNKDALFDDIGGANDPTKAVAEVSAAIASAKAVVDKIDAGTETPTARSLAAAFDASGNPISNPYTTGTVGALGAVAGGPVPTGTITPSGTNMDGPNGFLFKPKADHGGMLAVLVPFSATSQAVSCALKDSSGNVIEEGVSPPIMSPEPTTGAPRKKFSFKQPGGNYEKNLTVEVKYSDGSVAQYAIPDPSKRYD